MAAGLGPVRPSGMVLGLTRVSTRQRAFLRDHGFPPEIVVGEVPCQTEGVTTVAFLKDHSWQLAGGTFSMTFGAGYDSFTYGYPNDQIAAAAAVAREEEWAETIGPEGVRQLAALRTAQPTT